MTDIPSVDDYVLGRGVAQSVRLDAQHLLWKLHMGFVLHPSVPIKENMKIAELGCGTGIWLLDLAQELPSTVQIHGFDISNKQFPPSFLWPGNVSFSLLDSLDEPPPSLTEQYDVIHVRMWASNLRSKDAGILIQNVRRMLKPGGYLQWEEADLRRQVVQTPLAETFERDVNDLFERAGLQYSWVHELSNSLKNGDLQILSHQQETFGNGLRQFAKREHAEWADHVPRLALDSRTYVGA
ncbi:S-adenosyl-L-methionine-dependent methyltransferase [Nemania abortiva]|nr:S-adenosyl-L-methionine-dependent methyltransferase [Nemania abortiva]